MDFGKAFTFMFEDPEWLAKLGIGTLMLLMGIVLSPVLVGFLALFIVMGYGLDVIRNVLNRRPHPLPEWQDWGGFLGRGLKLFGVLLVWSLPLILVAIPIGIGSALTDNQGNLTAIGGLFVSCGSCLAILYGILLVLIYPAIFVRLAHTDSFASAFEIGKLWAFTRDNLANVIIAILLTIVAGIIATIIAALGLCAVVIGILVTIPFASLWATLVQMHLYGQIAPTV